MANIKVSDLHPAGFNLFSDSESYMRELSDAELVIQGGGILTWIGSAISWIRKHCTFSTTVCTW